MTRFQGALFDQKTDDSASSCFHVSLDDESFGRDVVWLFRRRHDAAVVREAVAAQRSR